MQYHESLKLVVIQNLEKTTSLGEGGSKSNVEGAASQRGRINCWNPN